MRMPNSASALTSFFNWNEWKHITRVGEINRTIRSVALRRIRLPISTKAKPKTDKPLFADEFGWLAVRTRQSPDKEVNAAIVV